MMARLKVSSWIEPLLFVKWLESFDSKNALKISEYRVYALILHE